MGSDSVNTDSLHFDNKHWRSEIRFFKDEILTFEKLLREVSGKYTDVERKKEVEMFQNRFIAMSQESESLMDAVELHEKNLATISRGRSSKIAKGDPFLKEHEGLEEKETSLRADFSIVRQQYRKWLAHWM
ncbi:hypothetical protein [Fulvitalea axinellae]